MIFSAYDEEGRVLFHGDVPYPLIQLQADNIVFGEVNTNTHYILNKQEEIRPASPVTIDSLNILRGIPAGSVIKINDKSYPATANFCELTFTYPGEYIIRVECFPYLDFTVVINK